MSVATDQFKGRTIVVTGAGSGMGATTARMLGAEGAAVVVTDRDERGIDATVEAIRSAGGEATPVVVDLLDRTAPEKIVGATIAAYGSLHSMVCCAGLLETAPLDELEIDSWERVMTVNLRAPVFLVKAALPHLGDGSAVVLIASQCAVTPGAFQQAYAASKGGLVTAVQSLSAELGEKGIRVNAVSPGATDTPQSAGADEEFEHLSQVTPDRRVGQPEDIAYAVRFLLSDASSHIHAFNMMVDGGHSRTSAAPPHRTDA